jgi:hypothetical protein
MTFLDQVQGARGHRTIMTKALWAIVPLLAAGCSPSEKFNLGEDVFALTADWRAFHSGPNAAVDILFMVDNSTSMTLMQEQLAQGFTAFMTVLDNLPGGTPDLHIGVVSSDMGAGVGINGCLNFGDNGVLQRGQRSGGQCPTPADNFIALRTDPATGARTNNYTGTLPEVFGCIALLGAAGCGLEQPLLSVLRATGADGFEPPGENQGFLRPEAFLAVILVTNEDDCSATEGANSPLFSTNPNTLAGEFGPVQSFRCNEFGHLCLVDGQLRPPSRTQALSYESCQSMEGGMLTKVSDFVTALRRLKGDPAKVFVASIAGPATPYQVALRQAPISDTGDWPVINPSCGTNADGLVFADPAVRLAHMTRLLGPYGLFESICGDGSNMPLENIARQMTAPIDSPCVPFPSAGQSCRVVDRWIDADGAKHAVDVTSCIDDPAAIPCWQLADDAACPGEGRLQVNRGGTSAAPGLMTAIDCGGQVI